LRLNVLSASEWHTWLRKSETASSQKFIVKRNYFRHYVFTTLKLIIISLKCKSTLGRVDGTSRSAISTSDDLLVLLVLKAQLTVHPAKQLFCMAVEQPNKITVTQWSMVRAVPEKNCTPLVDGSCISTTTPHGYLTTQTTNGTGFSATTICHTPRILGLHLPPSIRI